jgi:hypothetical protein
LGDLVSVGDVNHHGINDLTAAESATGKLFLYPGVGTSFPVSVAGRQRLDHKLPADTAAATSATACAGPAAGTGHPCEEATARTAAATAGATLASKTLGTM